MNFEIMIGAASTVSLFGGILVMTLPKRFNFLLINCFFVINSMISQICLGLYADAGLCSSSGISFCIFLLHCVLCFVHLIIVLKEKRNLA